MWPDDENDPLSRAMALPAYTPPTQELDDPYARAMELPNYEPFDPDGPGYDYETAKAHGIGPDETGHWPSREPETGVLLKGSQHPTWEKTIEGEASVGNRISKAEDGRYYSQPHGYDPNMISPVGNIMKAISDIRAYLGEEETRAELGTAAGIDWRNAARLLMPGGLREMTSPMEERHEWEAPSRSAGESVLRFGAEHGSDIAIGAATAPIAIGTEGALLGTRLGASALGRAGAFLAGEAAQGGAQFAMDVERGYSPEEAAIGAGVGLGVGGVMRVAGKAFGSAAGELVDDPLKRAMDLPPVAPKETMSITPGRTGMNLAQSQPSAPSGARMSVKPASQLFEGAPEDSAMLMRIAKGEGKSGTDLLDEWFEQNPGKKLFSYSLQGDPATGKLSVAKIEGASASKDMQGFVQRLIQKGRAAIQPDGSVEFYPPKVTNAAPSPATKTLTRDIPEGYDTEPVMGGGLAAQPPRGGAAPGEKAGNIRLDKIETSDDVIDIIRQQGRVHQQDLTKARGAYHEGAQKGVIPDKVVRKVADQLGQDPAALKATLAKAGTKTEALNEYELLALGDLHVSAAEDLDRIIKRNNALGDRVSDADIAELVESGKLLLEIEKGLTRSTATAGRATRVGAQIRRGNVNMEDFIKAAGGRNNVKSLTSELGKVADKATRSKMLKRVIEDPSLMDKLYAVRIAFMLSNFYGRGRDIASNVTQTFVARPVKTLLRHPIEGPQRVVAQFRGAQFREATEVFWQTWKQKQSVLGRKGTGFRTAQQFPEVRDHSYRYEGSAGQRASAIDKIENKYLRYFPAKVARISTDLVQALDDASKILSFSSKMGEDAWVASKAGKGTFEHLMANPTKEMIEAADKIALEETFQNNSYLAKAVTQLRSTPGVRWVVPFARVAANITTWGLEHHPVSGLAIAGAKIAKGARGEQALDELVKPAFGGMMLLGAGLGIHEGVITGGSPTTNVEGGRIAKGAGWKPYSIKVGDVYYDYRRYPFGQLMASLADMVIAYKDDEAGAEERLMFAAKGFADNLLVPGVVRSLSDFLERKWGESYAERGRGSLEDIAVSFAVPGIFRMVADHAIDLSNELSGTQELQKQPEGVIENIKYGYGIREGLEDRENPYTGEPIPKVTNFFTGAVGPASKADPEMETIALRAEDIYARSRRLSTSGVARDLADVQADMQPGEAGAALEEALGVVERAGIHIPTRDERRENDNVSGMDKLAVSDSLEAAQKSGGNSYLEKAFKLAWIEAYRADDRARLQSLERDWKSMGFNFDVKTLREALQ